MKQIRTVRIGLNCQNYDPSNLSEPPADSVHTGGPLRADNEHRGKERQSIKDKIDEISLVFGECLEANDAFLTEVKSKESIRNGYA